MTPQHMTRFLCRAALIRVPCDAPGCIRGISAARSEIDAFKNENGWTGAHGKNYCRTCSAGRQQKRLA